MGVRKRSISITERLKKVSYGLSTEHCDPVLVSQKVCAGVYKGVTTSQLDELAAETAAAMTANHPYYASLAAQIVVSNSHKKTKKSFSETIKEMYNHFSKRSGLKAPLVADDVYEIIMKNVAQLDSEIIYDRDFDYDYFGFKTLERSYLLKVQGKVVERPQHMLMRVAVGIHKDDIESAIKTYHFMSQRWFTDASPTLFNAGTPRPQAAFKSGSTWCMALFFSFTTPVGIAIGIGITNVYDDSSPTALVVQGLLNSVAAGILIYMALVDLLAQDFMNSKVQTNTRLFFGANVTLLLGAGIMALLALWA